MQTDTELWNSRLVRRMPPLYSVGCTHHQESNSEKRCGISFFLKRSASQRRQSLVYAKNASVSAVKLAALGRRSHQVGDAERYLGLEPSCPFLVVAMVVQVLSEVMPRVVALALLVEASCFSRQVTNNNRETKGTARTSSLLRRRLSSRGLAMCVCCDVSPGVGAKL